MILGGCASLDAGRFNDPDDGQFDLGHALRSETGMVPVPDVIAEPAIGYGLGLAALVFSEPVGDTASSTEARPSPGPTSNPSATPNPDATSSPELTPSSNGLQSPDAAPAAAKAPPPSLTGIGAFATGTHNWGTGLLHFHTWDDDRIRYLGMLGWADLHLNYYGPIGVTKNAYQLSGVALSQQVLFRIGDTPWYVGPRYAFSSSSTRFDGSVPQSIENYERTVRIGKAGVVVDYDTRDNLFDPNQGTYAEMEAELARAIFGSEADFEMESARVFHWFALSKTWVLGLRAAAGFSQGNVPFFAQPYVDLRGVAHTRFQDRDEVTGELELRYYVTPRWSVLGFGGVGRAYGGLHSFTNAPIAYGVGTGFRYLIVRKLGMTIGIDIAHGPEQNAIYVQIGSAWR
jgi:hypothetical protein